MVNHSGKPSFEDAEEPPGAESDVRLDEVFGALGSSVRRTLLARLRAGALAVTELGAGIRVSGPAISRHLRVLEAAGLVVRARDGRLHHISREEGPLREALAWLQGQGLGPSSEATPTMALERARAEARRLTRELAPVAALITRALGPQVSGPAGQVGPAGVAAAAGYMVFVLRRRLSADPALRAELVARLAALRALEEALPTLDSRPAHELESLTAGASRITWLIGQHPALADLQLLTRRPPAA